MISVQEADKIISENLGLFPQIKVAISEAYGKILREDITADRDSPPFNRVAMDGIAIDFVSWEKGTRIFYIEGIQKAGQEEPKLSDINNCFEVMTGAVLPSGTNCVIKIEDLKIENNRAILDEGLKPEFMQHIHRTASDHKKGTVLINRGSQLLSPQIAVAASVGKSQLLVAKTPVIAIISTGDELVEVDQEVKPFQIRISNSYALQAALKGAGFEKVELCHLPDNEKTLSEKLAKILLEFDVIILSGGVSMGKFDYVPAVLNSLNVKMAFHKITQKPGKPFWFGTTNQGKPVFALPGNPVSTLICFRKYILPNLFKALGLKNLEEETAILMEDITFKPNLTYFLPVRVFNQGGTLKATPVKVNGSGDYAALVNSDGFVELEAGQSFFPLNFIAPLYRWRF